jgi:polyprenyldihydroxybenzoate methyltransferase/3-demethylubiquinol 3-O-methyltransferase
VIVCCRWEVPKPNTNCLRTHTSTAADAHPASSSTVNPLEADKFAKLAGQWWDPAGPFQALHQLNPVRCAFIREALCHHYHLNPVSSRPLEGLRILDVGCGGGILSEALARMGATVVGIDVNAEGLEAAAAHASTDPDITAAIEFRQSPVEDVAAGGETFDAVMASEVIEHVDNVPAFCAAVAAATKPGGAVVVSTINRTPQAYALAVAAAEYVLKLVPVGTHDWARFITPAELAALMQRQGGLEMEQLAGMVYDPLRGVWELSRSTAVNYIAYFKKAG